MAKYFFFGRLSARDALTWSWLLIWSLVAFIWSFAESVWFFIIVDVLLSLAVMRFGFLRAMLPALAALAGSLLGGTILYYWGELNPKTVKLLMLTVPGIDADLFKQTAYDMADVPLKSMLVGGFTGIPFKLFASVAYESVTPLAAFLKIAIIARTARFAAVLGIAVLLRALLYKRLRRVGLIRLTLFLWVIFYAWYGYVFWNIV